MLKPGALFLEWNASQLFSGEEFSEMKAFFSVFRSLPSSSCLSIRLSGCRRESIPAGLFHVCACEESKLIKVTCFKGPEIAGHCPPGPSANADELVEREYMSGRSGSDTVFIALAPDSF